MSGDTTFTGDVVPSASIDNLIRQRDAVVERLTAAMRLIWEAEALARYAAIGFPKLQQELRGIDSSLYSRRKTHYHGSVLNDDDAYQIDEGDILSKLTRAVDAGAWAQLMNESGLRTFMDRERREQWDEKIYTCDVPTLDREHIDATFQSMYLNRGEMLEDGVIKCFKRLSWCYKTNKPFHFGPRIILRGFGEYNHTRCNELDDLVRVFHVLDGKPEPDHRNGMYHSVSEAYRAAPAWPKLCETEYLSIKLFKNTNAHVLFKRADVVERMNEMLTRRFPGALPYDRRHES